MVASGELAETSWVAFVEGRKISVVAALTATDIALAAILAGTQAPLALKNFLEALEGVGYS